MAKARGDGGGVSTTRAVGGDAGHEGSRKLEDLASGEEQVGGGGAAEVSALEEKGHAKGGYQFFSGLPKFAERGDGAAKEGDGFVEVWGNQGGDREESLAVETDGA